MVQQTNTAVIGLHLPLWKAYSLSFCLPHSVDVVVEMGELPVVSDACSFDGQNHFIWTLCTSHFTDERKEHVSKMLRRLPSNPSKQNFRLKRKTIASIRQDKTNSADSRQFPKFQFPDVLLQEVLRKAPKTKLHQLVQGPVLPLSVVLLEGNRQPGK